MAGDEIEIIDGWIKDRLTGNAALVALVGTRIFDRFAPPEQLYPLTIFQSQSQRDVRGVGSARIMVDTLYVVKAIARADSYDQMRDLANAIDDAMTVPQGGVVVGGFVLTSIREEPFRLVEIIDGRQVRHSGGVFRVYAQAA